MNNSSPEVSVAGKDELRRHLLVFGRVERWRWCKMGCTQGRTQRVRVFPEVETLAGNGTEKISGCEAALVPGFL